MKSTINNATNNKQVEEYSIKLKNIGCFEVYKTCDRKRGIVYFLCLEGDIVESFNSFVDLKKFCKKYNYKKFYKDKAVYVVKKNGSIVVDDITA